MLRIGGWIAIFFGIVCSSVRGQTIELPKEPQTPSSRETDTPAASEEISPETLINSVVRRSTAFYSGLIEWEHTSLTPTDPKPPLPTRTSRQTMGIHGDDWVLRYPDSENFGMCSNGVRFSFAAISDPDGKTIHRSMAIEPPQNLIDWIGMGSVGHALRGGALPWEKQVLYIDTHRAEATRMPDETIEEQPCSVLQWRVQLMDFDDGLITFPMEIAVNKEGLLRLYISTQLDGALMRIEYRTKDDRVVYQRNHYDFKEVADRLWFPMRMLDRTFIEGKWSEETYKIIRVEHVNQKLPDEVFAFKVPLGTRVRDERPGMPRLGFQLKDPKQVDSLSTLLEPKSSAKPSVSWRRILLWLNGFLLFTLLIYWKSFRSSTTSSTERS